MAPVELRALEEQVVAQAALVHAATAELASLVAQLHAAGGCVGGGIRSVSHWANINLGMASGQRLAEAAGRLEELPAVAAAWRSGALSADKVILITSVATPALDEELARIGQEASLAQLQRICGELRRHDDDTEEAVEQRRALRSVRSGPHHSGLHEIVALLEPEEAAIVLKALDARVEDRWREERDAQTAPDQAPPAGIGARRADALVLLATEGIEAGPRPVVGGEGVEVVVHVELDALLRGESGGAWIDGVGSLPRSTVERLLCDCAWRPMYEEAGGNPLDLGRRRRTVSKKQRRALRRRDRGCRYPGCRNHTFVAAHHVLPWELGGTTDMDNLILLCPFHHRLFHEGGYRLTSEGGGRFTFRTVDGREIRPKRRRPAPTGTRPTGSPRALDGGAPFDLDVVVEHLQPLAG